MACSVAYAIQKGDLITKKPQYVVFGLLFA